jgi:hypothetical protein
MQLLHRPLLAPGRVVAHFGRGEAVEAGVVGRMHGHQLALQMSRELGDLDAVPPEHAFHFVAVGLAFRGRLEIEEAGVPARDLHPLVAQARRPPGDGLERIEGCAVARELGQEDGRALDGLHGDLLGHEWEKRRSYPRGAVRRSGGVACPLRGPLERFTMILCSPRAARPVRRQP